MEWQYNEDKTRIVIEPPKRTKKITGHRFPSVLGQNKYQTPFGAWCEITGLVKLPFEDNKYTIAGKTIEPKQIDYAKQKFPNIMSCEEYYGNSFSEYQYSNYKDMGGIFDGVRDFVSTKNDRKTIVMVGECKTSSHPEQWENNSVPTDYLLQGMLYAHLDKLDKVLFVASFLDNMDYNNPENYVVSPNNTKFVVKKMNDVFIQMPSDSPMQYGGIQDCINYCENWWETYVATGISPAFDEVKDKEYLDIIRASKPTNDNDLLDVCKEAITIAKEIKELEVSSGIAEKEKQLKILETAIKEKMIAENITNCDLYTLKLTKKIKLDEKKLQELNKKLYDECCTETESYTLTKKLKGD